MERKLASLKRISDIKPIVGSDNIQLATVGGWKVVVAKDSNFSIGDLVVYFEIESFLPMKLEFEFLRKSSFRSMNGVGGFALRTMKIRKQLSQGLILPLSILDVDIPLSEGMDVTELLGVTKWEAPISPSLGGKAKGGFPSFLRKTDQERVQNLTEFYKEWKESDIRFVVTEKLDGSSATFYINNGNFGVCSRNIELSEPLLCESPNSFWSIARTLDLENKMKSLNRNICIQGELIGSKIQGNPYKLSCNQVRFFSALDIDTGNTLPHDEFSNLITELGLDLVPVLEDEFKLPETIEDLLTYAEGTSALNKDTVREGVVIKSFDSSISFKAISNHFLLRKGE